MDGIVVIPFAAPDKSMLFKNTYDLFELRILNEFLRISARGVGFATAPLPIDAKPVRQSEINSDTEGVCTRAFGAADDSVIKGTNRFREISG